MSVPGGTQRGLLRRLAESGTDFVLIGGHAVAAHGYERATRDVDIVYSASSSSCEKLASLLVELRAEIITADLPTDHGIDSELLAQGGHFRFATESGPLDALTEIGGLDYEALSADSITVELDDFALEVCSYPALVAMKRGTDRARDEEDLRNLEQMREEPPKSG